jgi:ABC-type multidrug transport system fused ATPase/permease subunit
MVILFFSITGNESKIELTSTLPFLALVSACIIKLLPSFKSISGSLTHIVAYTNSLFLLTSQIQKTFKINEKTLPQIKDVNSPNILELDKINFHYQNDSKTLIDIDLNLKSKSIIGLIGRSGSGKSTLINIILGLFAPSSGTIKFNLNKNHNTYDNKKIAYVPQDILILDDTLKKNIAFGIEDEKIDEARIVEVIEKSGLLNFYQKNQSSLDISLGESGVKISGGEKQRIGIARALYFNTEILILDESTSSLDNYTESLILNEISRFKGRISIIIISHKLSTLKICEDVYYLKNGKIQDVDNLKSLEKKYPELNIKKN